MPKLALIDIDNCLVANVNSALNIDLVTKVRDEECDAIWLFSGRNGTDMWRHVLRMGHPPPDWQSQLIFRLMERLDQEGVHIDGVSLPYDHVYGLPPGTGYTEKGLAQVEREIASVLTGSYSEIERIISNKLAGVDEHMLMELAITDDMKKEGQIKHLFKHIFASRPDDDTQYNVIFYDDLRDNLEAVEKHLSSSRQQKDIEITTVFTDFS